MDKNQSKKKIKYYFPIITIIIFAIMMILDTQKRPKSDNISLQEQETQEEKIENLAFKSSKGKLVSLETLSNKIILINFWASWCAPCEIEFPFMIDLLKKNPDKIALVSISIDENKNKYDIFIKKMEKKIQESFKNLSNIHLVRDPEREITLNKFNIFRLPETYIIKDNLVIVRKIKGHQDWTNGRAKEFILSLL